MDQPISSLLVKQLSVLNTLGEGIQWCVTKNEIWWTDIEESRLYSYDLGKDQLKEFKTPEAVCSFAFIDSSEASENELLVAFESGIAYYNPISQKRKWLNPEMTDRTSQRLNDGRIDRQGRFWVGSMSLDSDDYSKRDGLGQLYRFDTHGRLEKREKNIHISNGLCWSPDSKHMYFSDSARGEIYRYDFDPVSGTNRNRILFAKTPKGAFPDGACVDAKGYVWSAHWGASKVVRYNPSGLVDTEIKVPASQPSCVAFGGKDLNLLLVTSARTGLTDEQLLSEPHAGNVFIFETNVAGLPESRYKNNLISKGTS